MTKMVFGKINFINSAIGHKETNIKIFRNNTGSGTLVNDFGSDYFNQTEENQKKLSLQQEAINSTYTWDQRSAEWINLFKKAREEKK